MTKKQTKKLNNTVKKEFKKNPKPFIIVGSIILVVGIAALVTYKVIQNNKAENQEKPDAQSVSINFLELGNYHTGDCTYIKAGETDILIDAGSIASSADTIADYLNKPGRVEDGKIEYLVVTHCHEDHISALVGSKKVQGILDRYNFDNIIYFSQVAKQTDLCTDFYTKVETLKSKGTTVEKADEAVGKIYSLAEETTMEILDQKYYHEASSNENNNSVVTLFTQKDNHYLLTGDLEESGESSLVDLNPNLPHCQLYKASHHGSYTANTDKLLSKITPEIVCVSCTAGNKEYATKPENMFPAQASINRLGQYTDKIYVTTYSTDGDKGFASMNGNITFYCEKGSDYTVTCSNNNTILKDTQWFKDNRSWPEIEK